MTATREKTAPTSNVQSRKMWQTRIIPAFAGFAVVNIIVATALVANTSGLNLQSLSDTNYTSPMYGTWTWWMARGYVQQSALKAPDVALLGSSQVNSPSWAADAHLLKKPIDCLDHRQVIALASKIEQNGAHPTVINCAVQGGMASDYYMIERALFADGNLPELVIVCVSPRDFIDNKLPSAASTEPFRFFSRFSDPGRLTELAYPDLKDRFFAVIDTAINRLPLKSLTDLCESKIKRFADKFGGGDNESEELAIATISKKSENALAQAISNGQLQVKLGEWVVPPDMKNTFVDNTAEYQKRYAVAKPASFGVQVSFLQELLADLHSRGSSVLVVEMPTLPMNRVLLPQTFWREYKQTLSDACAKNNASVIDMTADSDFQKTDFLDTVHLNDVGGLKFFDKVASIICADQTLKKNSRTQFKLSEKSQ